MMTDPKNPSDTYPDGIKATQKYSEYYYSNMEANLCMQC
jgi:hypothetical protein